MATNVLRLMGYVQEQGERGRQRGEQNAFARLTPAALQGDPMAQQQQVAINPTAAAQVRSAGDDQAMRLRGAAKYMQEAITSGDPRRVQGAWSHVGPYLGKLTGKPVPEQWDPAMQPAMEQALASTAYLEQGGDGARVQSRWVAENGDVMYTMADGRTMPAGFKADRQMWLRDHPGIAPTLVGKDGSERPVGGAPSGPSAPAAPTRADMEADIQLANDLSRAGIPSAQIDAFLAQRGQRAQQMAPGVVPTAMGGAPAPQQPAGGRLPPPIDYVRGGAVRPSEAQVAAEVEAARQAAQTAALAEQERIKNDAAIERERRSAQITSAGETVSAAPGAIQTMENSLTSIDELLNSPQLGSVVGLGSMNPLNRLPGTEGRGLIARADQIAGQAFLAAFNQLKGGGAITEREGQAATQAMARLDRSQSEADYRQALTDLKAAIEPAIARQRAALGNARQTMSGGPAQATGPQPGAVEDGYRFRGGNPADPNAWERI